MQRFLAALSHAYRHTVEFRHESWLVDEVFELLSEYGVALCIPDRPKLPRAVRLTADWAYLRFHYGAVRNGDYSDQQLDEWAAQIQAFLDQGASVWAYFNNDWDGYAVKNALGLKERLAGKSARR